MAIKAYDNCGYPRIPEPDTAICIPGIHLQVSFDIVSKIKVDSPNSVDIWICFAARDSRYLRAAVSVCPPAEQLPLLDVPAQYFLVSTHDSLTCA